MQHEVKKVTVSKRLQDKRKIKQETALAFKKQRLHVV